tara:strand:- start:4241 stop:5053 length:813 start_codon:yes stop_codon:yes gene_type:complete
MGIFDWFFGKKKTTSESTFEEKKEDLKPEPTMEKKIEIESDLVLIDKVILQEGKYNNGNLQYVSYQITKKENYSIQENYKQNGNLKSIELLFRKNNNFFSNISQTLYFKDGNEIVLYHNAKDWEEESVNIGLDKFEKLVRKELNLLKPQTLYEGSFYYEIIEEKWFGKRNSYMWCKIFRFLDKEHNVEIDNGMFKEDEQPYGEFYYDDSSNSYVDWSVIKKDLNSEDFLDIGNSIGNDEFEGTNDELLNYLRNKHGDETKIDLISNMEPI